MFTDCVARASRCALLVYGVVGEGGSDKKNGRYSSIEDMPQLSRRQSGAGKFQVLLVEIGV